jgi:hypothetical protein
VGSSNSDSEGIILGINYFCYADVGVCFLYPNFSKYSLGLSDVWCYLVSSKPNGASLLCHEVHPVS